MPISPRRVGPVSALLLAIVLLGTSAWAQHSFRPGTVWLDETGNPIQSHLGGILFEKGVYYWYGMDFRGKTLPPGTLPGMGCTWSYSKGVTVYSSRDLFHWKAGENQLTPDTANAGGLLEPLNSVVRPKVIKNDATEKFIMMVALTAPDFNTVNDVAYAVADRPEGPFEFKGKLRWCGKPNATRLWPGPWSPGTGEKKFEFERAQADAPDRIRGFDITLFKDDDGKAYLITARSRMMLYELSSDYTCAKHVEVMQGSDGEAPALFKDRGTYYLLTSRLTTYAPNRNTYFTASSIHGPWTARGPFARGPKEATTFDGQTTYVLPVAGNPHAFIFMADHFGARTDDIVDNLADATHIWLPLEVDARKRAITVN